jgi:hypothetical protein
VRDALAALKDRLIGEPIIADDVEIGALAPLVGDLGAPASGLSADSLRRVCGAIVGSPQFLLQGIAGRGGERPLLTPPNAGYDAVCAGLASSGLGTPGLVVSCSGGALVLATGRTAAPAPAPAPIQSRRAEPRATAATAAPDRPRRVPAPDPRRIPAPM